MRKIILSIFVSALFQSAVADCELKCPYGYWTFNRNPTRYNSYTSIWCVKAIFPSELLNKTAAEAICATESAVVTTFENEEERQKVQWALQSQLSYANYSAGSLIVDGHILEECDTTDRKMRNTETCQDSCSAYYVDDKHTDPTFMLHSWAQNEPSRTEYNCKIEACLALAISTDSRRTGKINDIQCDYPNAPNIPQNTAHWNFGVLCGKLPSFM